MQLKDLTIQELNAIAQFVLSGSTNGNPARGRINEAATTFGVSRQAVSKVWARAKQQMRAGIPISLVSRKIGSYRPEKHHFDKDKLQSLDYKKRRTYRSIATEMHIGKTTVGRWVKKGLMRPYTNAIKPSLKERNKINRLKFSLQSLEVDHEKDVIKFKSMTHIIHVDEKWFNLTRTNERYYLTAEEEEPYRACKNKRFIGKIMFLCVVARPKYDANGDCTFDGKIGVFPFTHQVPAKKNSKNRAVGTMETKPLDSITREVTKSVMINEVIPAIKHKWPSNASKNIVIQQDNAPPHNYGNDPDFKEAAMSDGFNIQVVFQPPTSPDTNVNDLGWFRALQSLQVATSSYSIDDFLGAVHNSFAELSHTKLNAVFLTLQSCLREIIIHHGANKYKIPHMGKDALMRSGNLPIDLEVAQELVQSAIDFLMDVQELEGLEELVGSIEDMEVKEKILLKVEG